MAAAIKTVAFIGLGAMGKPMARNLLKGGFALRLHDLSSEAGAELVRDGATWTSSPAEAVRGADCVITMLPNGPNVEAAVFDDNGIAGAITKDALYIDMSTIAPAVTDKLGVEFAQRGIAMLDAPVGRLPQHAVEGKLLIMVGGDAPNLERARPVFEKLGDTIVHCGPLGSGSRMKLVNNFMSITLNATTAEALTLAEASGIDPELARRVMLGTAAGQGHMGTTYPAKVLKGDVSPGFMIDLAAKDLGLALDLGQQLGLNLTTGRSAKDTYAAAQQHGHGRSDWTAIYAIARDGLKRQKK